MPGLLMQTTQYYVNFKSRGAEPRPKFYSV